ncbi:MAG: beta/gamma crystallin-related protein [Betaproteobacteria bacterium]
MSKLHLRSIATAAALAATAAGAAYAGEITLFEEVDFRGNSMRINSEVTSLDGTGMNDRVQSVVVRDGVWEVCRDANFSGGCIQLQPGRYPRMDGNFVRNISSLREVGSPRYVGTNPPYQGQAYQAPPSAQGGAWAQAVLYEGHDFQGRSFPLTRDVVRNLDRTGFNDRAESLRVQSGYWVFCSDANFEGECRTFGPGEYPNLPRELDRRISSGRQISNAYPYATQPQWDRR